MTLATAEHVNILKCRPAPCHSTELF